MTGSFHFMIELMRKYRNIFSYFYWMIYVQTFFVDVLSIKRELKCFLLLKVLTQEDLFSLFWWLTSRSYIFVNFAWKKIYDYVLILFFFQYQLFKKIVLRMSNYKDNKNVGLTMHHHLPKILLVIAKITCWRWIDWCYWYKAWN